MPLKTGTCWALAFVAWATVSEAKAADDVMNLKGSPGMTLGGTGPAAGDADTIRVFHGRFWAWHRRPVVVYAAPPVVYSGCYGCFGGYGGYAAAPVPAYGYAASGFAAPAYSAPPPAALAASPQPRAIVTLPRLGLSFSLGQEMESLASRPVTRFQPPPRIQDQPPLFQPSAPAPNQFQYDGGPSNPIPLPGNVRPLTIPEAGPAMNNRIKASATKPSWLAYGERPAAPPPPAPTGALLVRNGNR